MTWRVALATARDLLPRWVRPTARPPGQFLPSGQPLPPGQYEVRTFPRFSDAPLRWAPRPEPIALTVSVDGSELATLTEDDLRSHELVEQSSDFHCVTTWTVRGLRWQGPRFADIARSVVDGELPPYVVASAADRVSAVYVTEDLLGDDVLLATYLGGQPLDRRHGSPLRLVSPGQYGYKNPKHLVGLDFRSTEPASTLGPKEHLRARVEHEERHSTLPNWAVRTPYRLSIIPTALAAERGLRNSPD